MVAWTWTDIIRDWNVCSFATTTAQGRHVLTVSFSGTTIEANGAKD